MHRAQLRFEDERTRERNLRLDDTDRKDFSSGESEIPTSSEDEENDNAYIVIIAKYVAQEYQGKGRE